MKITAEIKGDKIIYTYKIGTSSAEGSMPLGTGNFLIFNELLQRLYGAMHHSTKDQTGELMARVWIDQNPGKAKDWLIEAINRKKKRATS